MDLKDKVAIVTGASAGIGAATVKALLKQGMKVVGFARRQEKIENLVDNHNGKLFARCVDLTKPQDIIDGFAWVTKNVGPVHILINNAGVSIPSSILTGELEAWQQIMDTNLMSYAIASKEAVKIMKDNKMEGYIININSGVAYYDLFIPGNVMYRSSKLALRAMTENIRVELARMNSKIRISSICPGVVKTEIMSANYGEQASESFYSKYPHITSEDVADTIVYVLSTPQRVNISELLIRPTGEDIKQMADI
ncbi:farnesol dehydrogenase-like [Onthophagus taurus]|uniref:farnesol dehydrogenase-like n=1 Tax=Onthophagus taurus TaxID=166361 RepID=UPI000C20B84E|nr:farnesol dehydrogenase-like [Onthophagus taurus]